MGKLFCHNGSSLTGCDPAFLQSDILRELKGLWKVRFKLKTRSVFNFIRKFKNDWNNWRLASKDEHTSKLIMTAEGVCRTGLLASVISFAS